MIFPANDYTNQYRVWGQQPSTVQTINGIENVKVNGAHGHSAGTGDEGYIYTGAVIRKYVNVSGAVSDRDLHRSHQSWKVFRYAEILLNQAEAAYELGLLRGDDLGVQTKSNLYDYFVKCMFGSERKTRYRPHFFPFTEPSCEVDVSCGVCHGEGCSFCKHSGWIEILGCGMVDPNVLVNCGIDPERYSGFAFGIGVERVAALRYDLPDLRTLMTGDMRFLNQF